MQPHYTAAHIVVFDAHGLLQAVYGAPWNEGSYLVLRARLDGTGSDSTKPYVEYIGNDVYWHSYFRNTELQDDKLTVVLDNAHPVDDMIVIDLEFDNLKRMLRDTFAHMPGFIPTLGGEARIEYMEEILSRASRAATKNNSGSTP